MITLLLVLILCGVGLWLIERFIPMPDYIRIVIRVVVVLFLILFLLDKFGVYKLPLKING